MVACKCEEHMKRKHELAASQALNSSTFGDEAKPEAPLVLLNPD